MDSITKEKLKKEALKQAVKSCQKESSQYIIAVAENFYQFLIKE